MLIYIVVRSKDRYIEEAWTDEQTAEVRAAAKTRALAPYNGVQFEVVTTQLFGEFPPEEHSKTPVSGM